MTELEGAILGVIRRTGGATAYFVRKVFLDSRSSEWSGSAGAVYPAMARMKKLGWLKAHAHRDSRGTTVHVLTSEGKHVHDVWLGDVKRATGAGIDPFRTRAGAWQELTPSAWRALKLALKRELQDQVKELKGRSPLRDEGEEMTNQLHIATLEARLRWLNGKR